MPVEKVAFDTEKVAFERHFFGVSVNAPTKEKARALFDRYGYKCTFSRSDIVRMFDIASSSEGKFINLEQENPPPVEDGGFLAHGFVKPTLPDKPSSKHQKYVKA